MFVSWAPGIGSPGSLRLYFFKSMQKDFADVLVKGVRVPVTMAAGVAHRALAFHNLSTVFGSIGGVHARLANRMLSVTCTWIVYGLLHNISCRFSLRCAIQLGCIC
jgi:Mg2+ and Co2+ transporter CorA